MGKEVVRVPISIPPLLAPSTKTFITLLSGSTIDLPTCRPVFSEWTGKPPAFNYGNKPTLNDRGKAAYAELVILNLLRASGWEGVWVANFGGTHFLRDMPSGWKLASQHVAIPPKRKTLLDSIRRAAGTTGCFDIFAWKNNDVLFCEAKHKSGRLKGNDRLTKPQYKFIEGALACGVCIDSLLFVEWRVE
jgi:hypothetical protein